MYHLQFYRPFYGKTCLCPSSSNKLSIRAFIWGTSCFCASIASFRILKEIKVSPPCFNIVVVYKVMSNRVRNNFIPLCHAEWEKVMLVDRDLFSISHCLYFISHLNKAHLNMVLTFSCMISETSSSYSNVSYVSTFFYPGKRWYSKMFALSLLLLFGIFVKKLFETNPNFRYFG